MFCPTCRDEFRPGFTRCTTCDVALVESLDPEHRRAAPTDIEALAPVAMVEYCGFVSLDEARHARDRLRGQGIRGEIVIRDGPTEGGRPTEEYWLRVDRDRFRDASTLLGFDEAEHEADDGTFQCGECGAEVAAEESFCPGCGARFEEA